MNNILIGIVKSNNDETRTGILLVSIPDVSDSLINVIMTSPFYMLNGGGILAIPETGSKILILWDNETNKYYYLSTIIEEPDNEQKGGLLGWKVIGDNYVYTERGRPQRVTYTDQFQSGLKISRRLLPNYMSCKVDLDSEKGKRISLSDSPMSDMVLIRNEHGDGIVISSKPNNVHSDRSIEIKSKGAQRHVVFQSSMEFYVIDGRDITIENQSTGAFANQNATGRYGNINLRSHSADINITSKADDGSIFITTPRARIQIEPDGSVVVEATSIQLKSTGDINIKADNAIKIEGASIDIKANDIRMSASNNVDINSNTRTNIDSGGQVHLAPGGTPTANSAVIEQPIKNDYNE